MERYLKFKKFILKNFSIFAGIFIITIGAASFHFRFYPFEFLNNKIYDSYFKIRGKKPHKHNIVIVAIDEQSLREVGRWPWPRKVLAHLIENLSKDGAYVVGMDIILSEPAKYDKELGKAMENAGNIVLSAYFSFKKGEVKLKSSKGILPYLLDIALPLKKPKTNRSFGFIEATSGLFPEKIFLDNAVALGHINIFPDPDGVTRKEPLYIEYKNLLIPSFSLEIAALYKNIYQGNINVIPGKGIMLGRTFIPTDYLGRIFIPYYGPNYTFQHIPAVDVLQNRINPKVIKNKIVLIGATAAGLYDLRVTPFSPVFFGVEEHADVIEALISNELIKPLSSSDFYFIYFFVSLLFLFVVTRLSPIPSAVFSISSISICFVCGYVLFYRFYLWTDTFYPVFSLSFIFLTHNVWSYIYSERAGREMKKIFSSYVTPQVMDELTKKPELAKLGGDRRKISILFADIRGFTTLSEQLEPEDVVGILNEYFEVMVDVIFKWHGTLDKFIGDAIMVFWGAPLYQEDHTSKAFGCSLDMLKALEEKNREWKRNKKFSGLSIGIGINTGDVLVGNIGVEGKKMDYTVIGDNVNLASRLESLNKKFNSHILISENTLKYIKNDILAGKFGNIAVEEIGQIVVKGKTKAVKIYKAYFSSRPEIIELKEEKTMIMEQK